MSSLIDKKRSQKKQNAGFTVVELMVTITIIVLVTGLVMIRYSSFNSSVLLTSQAYITAFDFRETQSLAVSVRGNSTEFREEYGLYFDMSSPTQYLLFQDNETNGDHSPARYHAGEEISSPYTVDARFEIVNLCGTNSVSRTCYADDPETVGEVVDTSFSNLAVTFKRPDFDAAFYTASKSNLQSIEVQFAPLDGSLTKKVVVYLAGQITVE